MELSKFLLYSWKIPLSDIQSWLIDLSYIISLNSGCSWFLIINQLLILLRIPCAWQVISHFFWFKQCDSISWHESLFMFFLFGVHWALKGVHSGLSFLGKCEAIISSNIFSAFSLTWQNLHCSCWLQHTVQGMLAA